MRNVERATARPLPLHVDHAQIALCLLLIARHAQLFQKRPDGVAGCLSMVCWSFGRQSTRWRPGYCLTGLRWSGEPSHGDGPDLLCHTTPVPGVANGPHPSDAPGGCLAYERASRIASTRVHARSNWTLQAAKAHSEVAEAFQPSGTDGLAMDIPRFPVEAGGI
jgi:hypothetical protein